MLQNNHITQELLKRRKLIIGVLFCLVFLAGLISFRDYGIPWDEPNEINILKSNAKKYVDTFHFMKKDSSIYKEVFTDIDDIEKSEEIDHGEAIYYPVSIPMLLLRNNQHAKYQMLHLYYFIIFFCALICLYSIVRVTSGRRIYGMITSLFLLLSPRILGESFYNNKDIVLMSLIIILLWFSLKLMLTKKISYAVLLGITGAFACNLRVISYFLLLLIGITYFIHIALEQQLTKKNVWNGLITIPVFFIAFFAITPAAWSDVIGYYKYVIKYSKNFARWTGYVLYQGEVYLNIDGGHLPWHYLPVMFAITTPVLIVLFICIAPFTYIRNLLLERKNFLKSTESQIYLICFCFLLPLLLYTLLKHPTIYNGWRHFYFMYGPLLILASLAVKTLCNSRHIWVKSISYGVICLQLFICAVLIAKNHPNEFSYYNFLAGAPAEENYETDYWNVSTTQCIRQLLDSVDSDEKITIAVVDWHTLYGILDAYHYGLTKEEQARLNPINEDYSYTIEDGTYYIINPTYQLLAQKEIDAGDYEVEPPFDIDGKLTEVTSVKAFGNTLMAIYKAK